MVRTLSRLMQLICALVLICSTAAHAEPITVDFTAKIGSSNDIDTEDLFKEGFRADLAGQVITGSVTIDPAPLKEVCGGGGACYGDVGAGAISVSFTLNGVTSTVVSTGTLGYFGGGSGGSVLISDPSEGLGNYLAAGATSPNGMMQESIGALFNRATLFSAYGNGAPSTAVDSLNGIGDGSGLVNGGITLLSPIEHLDATMLSVRVGKVDVPEPAGLTLFGAALIALGFARWKIAG